MNALNIVIAVLLAAEAASPVYTDILGYGAIGVMFVLFLIGQAVPGYLYKAEVARGNRLEAENKALNDSIKNDVIPLVIQANQNAATVAKAGERIARASETLAVELERQRGSSDASPA